RLLRVRQSASAEPGHVQRAVVRSAGDRAALPASRIVAAILFSGNRLTLTVLRLGAPGSVRLPVRAWRGARGVARCDRAGGGIAGKDRRRRQPGRRALSRWSIAGDQKLLSRRRGANDVSVPPLPTIAGRDRRGRLQARGHVGARKG